MAAETFMHIPLSNSRRWQFAAGMALFAALYLFLTAKEFAASFFAARPQLASLERAVRLSPGNADYRHRLGRYFAFVGGDPQSAIDNFRVAVALNPHDAHYWLDLAAAYQVTENLDGRRGSLEKALQAEPTAPYVAWEAANFFLIDGDIDRALHEFRVVIENDVELVDASLRACWRARPDADALLRDAVPARTDTLIAFVSLLSRNNDIDGAIKAWDRLAQLHQNFERRYLYDFVNYLIAARRPEAAMAAWEESVDTLALTDYLPSDDNLVVNGDFSLDVLNGGFDWTYVNRTGVRMAIDPGDFRKGRGSLSLTFEGPGISDAGIQQLIPVRGGTTYDFSAYYKSADFEGAGGPEIVVRDAYTGAQLYTSDPLRDADFWKETHAKVPVPKATSLLVLTVDRVPAGSPIRGKLWLDDFELAPESAADSAGATSVTSKATASTKDRP